MPTVVPVTRTHGIRRRIATFDGLAAVSLIAPRPLLLIVGRQAVTSWMSVHAFQNATGPKELHWIHGASHVDLYDKDEYVTPAIAKLAESTRRTWTSRRSRPGSRPDGSHHLGRKQHPTRRQPATARPAAGRPPR